MDIWDHHLAVDFETYYGKGCSVIQLGVSQYVKHPEFEVLTMSYWTPRMDKPQCLIGEQAVADFFDELKPYAEHITLSAHNTMFDGYIAARNFGFIPGFYVDTIAMAAAQLQQFTRLGLADVATFFGVTPKIEGVLGNVRNKRWNDLTPEQQEALIEYNNGDVISHVEILNILRRGFPEDEMRVIDMVTRMFCDPMLVADAQLAREIWENEKKEKREIVKASGYPRAVFTSKPKFGALLRELGYTIPEKLNPKGEWIDALARQDIGFIQLEEQGENDPQLAQLLETRKRVNSNIIETRAQAVINRSDEPVPIAIRYCAAHTMRFGGGDKFNPQNFPNKTRIRNTLCAPPGYKLVIVDAAQIEARVNAWLAGQDDLIEQFTNREDVYSIFATKIFGHKVTKATHYTERYIGKTCVLGLGYQMGAQRLKDELKIGRGGPSLVVPLDECQRYVYTYRNENDKIVEQWRNLNDLLHVLLPTSNLQITYRDLLHLEAGRVLMPNGLYLYYPGMSYTVNEATGWVNYSFTPHGVTEPVNMFGGKFTENIVQSLARTVTTGHMLELATVYRPVLMAHDEIVLCVPEAKAETAYHDALEVMEVPPAWASGLPLEAEGCIAPFYTKPD